MRKVIIILLLVICSATTYAEHIVGVSISPAATWQLDSLPNTHSLPSIAGDVGFVYQYQYRALLLQTGINIGMVTMRQGIDSILLDQNQILRNHVDGMQAFELGLPLMIGAKVRHVYALAGIKMNFTSEATTSQRGTIAIREEDNRYHDDYNNVFLDTRNIHSRGRMSITPDLRACLEIGAQLKTSRYHRIGGVNPILQIGLFAEYSIINNHPTSYTEIGTANQTDVALKYVYAPYINDNLKIQNLHAGIRLTLLFDITNYCNCEEY